MVVLHCERWHVQGMMCSQCLSGAAGGSTRLERKVGVGSDGRCGQSDITKALCANLSVNLLQAGVSHWRIQGREET